MKEFGFMGAVYSNSREGPPVYVAKIEVLVEAETQEDAEVEAHQTMSGLLAPGFFPGDDLTPI